ncbi:unnamed protein product [Spirodela intermedia]|uniref:Uncharacterized protein n=1 Tax=Spirodela intermedia TaxID=51605 RepID=A0A7I8IB58_SPIIN|nr:unnamed protein product [Spirodela intermedia]CAA6654272.1 unnamed protein product [Spirodela intermedia]
MSATFIAPLSSLSRKLSSALSGLRIAFLHRHHIKILSLLESCESAEEFAQLHATIIRRGEGADRFVATRMLEFCASVSLDMSTATRIFDDLGRPDNVYMWTAMIRGFINTKDHVEALRFYDQMTNLGVHPYKFTFVSILKACTAVRDVRKGCCVHGSVMKVGLQSDVYLRSALVSLYGCCGDAHTASHLFMESLTNNCVVWNSMISVAFANGEIEMARKLFDDIPERDLTTWNAAVNGYSKLGLMDLAKAGREALKLLKEMLAAGIRPDAVTMATMLAACSQVGALDMGKWIHAYVDKSNLGFDVVLGTSLVDMYGKCGSIGLALQVFNRMKHKNISSWNVMLCGLAMHGCGDHALALFKEMESTNIEPTDISFVGVLSACSHIGAVEEGRRQFHRMCSTFKISPKIEHYGCMVDLLSRAGLISEARDLILSMPMEPNMIILGAFLNACKLHGDLSTAELVVRHISRLFPSDVGCYVLLSNIFASRNEWDGVTKMRKMVKGMGAGKIPGCSSIEVDSVVNEFTVNDWSHPRWRDMFDVIDQMARHLESEGYEH